MPPKKPVMPVYVIEPEVPAIPEVVEPVAEVTAPIRPSTPVFNHGQPAGVEDSTTCKALVQGVNRFTYAEFDKQKGRYVPEPHYIRPGQINRSELIQKIDKLNELLDKIPTMLLDLQESIINNPEILREG